MALNDSKPNNWKRSNANRKSFFISVILLITFLDQLSKWFITEVVIRSYLNENGLSFFDWLENSSLPRLPYVEIEITSFYNIVMVWNRGVSFGMFNDLGDIGPLVLIIIALVISFILLLWMLDTKSDFQGVCLAMIIGGSFGNILDRARFDAVIDFFDFHIYGYHWPAFNIADSAIVVGVCLLITHALFFEKNESNES